MGEGESGTRWHRLRSAELLAAARFQIAIRVSWPLPVSSTFTRAPAIRRVDGRRGKWNAVASVTFGRTSGRCAISDRNPLFLAFAREFNFYPRACNQASGWEKGKVERGGIGYVRQNFWPLRDF